MTELVHLDKSRRVLNTVSHTSASTSAEASRIIVYIATKINTNYFNDPFGLVAEV